MSDVPCTRYTHALNSWGATLQQSSNESSMGVAFNRHGVTVTEWHILWFSYLMAQFNTYFGAKPVVDSAGPVMLPMDSTVFNVNSSSTWEGGVMEWHWIKILQPNPTDKDSSSASPHSTPIGPYQNLLVHRPKQTGITGRVHDHLMVIVSAKTMRCHGVTHFCGTKAVWASKYAKSPQLHSKIHFC